MSDRRKPGFEDIRSSSSGRQSRPEWFAEARPTAAEAARRRQAERRAQREDPRRKKRRAKTESTRPVRKAAPGSRRSPGPGRSQPRSPQPRGRDGPGRPPVKPRPRKKPMSLFKRRLLIVLTLLAMLFGTGFLAESLLLRVTTVRVTGDMPYDEAEILRICGFRTGDNLLLIPASDREKKLETQLPYIAKADITRHIPGTVQIELTAAQGVCCLQVGTQWYTIASDGKVLEAGAGPTEGLMQVAGLTPVSARVGETLELEEGEASTAFMELLNNLVKLDDGNESPSKGFTRMDLTNLHDIRLWYQDRVECLMGSSTQLDYKLRMAYGNLTDTEKGIGQEETGVLDLTYLPTKRASYFTAGATAATPSPDGAAPELTDPGSVSPTPVPTPGRGDDIPDSPFTG